MIEEDDEDDYEEPKPKKKTASKKRKSEELDDKPPAKGRQKKTTTPSKTNAKKPKTAPVVEDVDVKMVLDDIPLVRPPTPPKRDGDGKFSQGTYKVNQGSAPAALGSKEIPEGADGCLTGLKFVFTGVLETLDREVGKGLVKKYGGHIQSAASSKTDYVVLGADAGPKKLETIKQNNLKVINEDGFFQLIRTLPAHGGSGVAATAAKEKAQKQANEAEKRAELMAAKEEAEAQELAKQKKLAQKAAQTSGAYTRPEREPVKEESKLWTVKYAPKTMDQIVGNKAAVERLARWLRSFRASAKTGFKVAGPDGSGTYRAVLIHGPPGIGKTTAAHLVAKLEGYSIVESNASDTRSKKMVEDGLRGVLSNTSLMGYFAGDGKQVQDANKKLVLIMDEVDGMSAGDRGGVGALAALCKKTSVPMILICNDRRLPKMKPFDYVTFDMPFRRPTTDQIRGRMMTIAFREGLKLPPPVLNALIEGTGADIRQTVNMLSTAKLDTKNLDYEKSKEMSKAWEKHIVLKPWDIANKILNGNTFAASSESTLNQKIELYFNDHEFSSLMLQENYLGTQPMLAGALTGQKRTLKLLELAEKASESISDGDLVDRMIHGTQQHWSLMPTHAVFGFVRPASFMAGNIGYGQTRFSSWLGMNSKQNRLLRLVKEFQGHMRLRSTADKNEVREQYMPVFWTKLAKRLEVEGKAIIPEIIDLMDSYYLTRDDFDAIVELGVGSMDEKHIKIGAQDKSQFTRMYNAQSHPLPFLKASSVFEPKSKSRDAPDLEEAAVEEDEEVVEDKKEEDDADISKDKYIKAPRKKAAPKAGKGKKRPVDDDAEDSEPKKPKGKGRAKK
jgi:replication factor C subunit 1